MKRAGEAGKALRAGGGADFIFSASERVVKAFTWPAGRAPHPLSVDGWQAGERRVAG